MNFLHKNFLSRELNSWIDERLIERENAEKIALKYGLNLNEKNLFTEQILRIIAYFFFGCSLILLVSSNWQEIPKFARFFMLLVLTGALNYVAIIQKKEHYKTALFFLASLVFGASIALISQMYHLNNHTPNALLLWAFGVLLTALISHKALISTLSIIIASFWYFSELIYGLSFITQIYLVFLFCGIYVYKKDPSKTLLALIFVGFYLYLIGLKNESILNYYVIFLSLSYAVFGLALATLAPKFSPKFKALYNISLAFGVVFLFISLTLESYSDEWFESFFANLFGKLFCLFCLFGLIVGAWAQKFALVSISALCFLAPFIIKFGLDDRIVFSLASVMVAGFLIKAEKLALGITLIFGVAIVRYIELVGDYIGSSLLFLIFAVIILILAKKRIAK